MITGAGVDCSNTKSGMASLGQVEETVLPQEQGGEADVQVWFKERLQDVVNKCIADKSKWALDKFLALLMMANFFMQAMSGIALFRLELKTGAVSSSLRLMFIENADLDEKEAERVQMLRKALKDMPLTVDDKFRFRFILAATYYAPQLIEQLVVDPRSTVEARIKDVTRALFKALTGPIQAEVKRILTAAGQQATMAQIGYLRALETTLGEYFERKSNGSTMTLNTGPQDDEFSLRIRIDCKIEIEAAAAAAAQAGQAGQAGGQSLSPEDEVEDEDEDEEKEKALDAAQAAQIFRVPEPSASSLRQKRKMRSSSSSAANKVARKAEEQKAADTKKEAATADAKARATRAQNRGNPGPALPPSAPSAPSSSASSSSSSPSSSASSATTAARMKKREAAELQPSWDEVIRILAAVQQRLDAAGMTSASVATEAAAAAVAAAANAVEEAAAADDDDDDDDDDE